MQNAIEMGILGGGGRGKQNQITYPTALLKLCLISVTIFKGAFSVLQMKIMLICSSSLK